MAPNTESGQRNPSEMNLEIIVIGAGPAGVQTGYFLKNANINYLVLEKSEKTCAFFRSYPRHRRLISINKKYNQGKESADRLIPGPLDS